MNLTSQRFGNILLLELKTNLTYFKSTAVSSAAILLGLPVETLMYSLKKQIADDTTDRRGSFIQVQAFFRTREYTVLHSSTDPKVPFKLSFGARLI